MSRAIPIISHNIYLFLGTATAHALPRSVTMLWRAYALDRFVNPTGDLMVFFIMSNVRHTHFMDFSWFAAPLMFYNSIIFYISIYRSIHHSSMNLFYLSVCLILLMCVCVHTYIYIYIGLLECDITYIELVVQILSNIHRVPFYATKLHHFTMFLVQILWNPRACWFHPMKSSVFVVFWVVWGISFPCFLVETNIFPRHWSVPPGQPRCPSAWLPWRGGEESPVVVSAGVSPRQLVAGCLQVSWPYFLSTLRYFSILDQVGFVLMGWNHQGIHAKSGALLWTSAIGTDVIH